jgi:hypothetical protein
MKCSKSWHYRALPNLREFTRKLKERTLNKKLKKRFLGESLNQMQVPDLPSLESQEILKPNSCKGECNNYPKNKVKNPPLGN